MILTTFALLAFGLSNLAPSTEAQSYYGYTFNDTYYLNNLFGSSQCVLETDRIWLETDFNDRIKGIYNYDLYYSDPDACIVDDTTGIDRCTYDLSVVPEEVIKQAEDLCHSFDGVFYLENFTNPYIITNAGEVYNGTSIFIESPQCYGLCSEDELMDYFGSTSVSLSAPSYGSERVNCVLETERVLSEYSERIPSPIQEVFNDENLCSTDSTGTETCIRDFTVLANELITQAEDECHDLGGVFYSIDYMQTYTFGDEELIEIGISIPYCFGACSEDQLRHLLEKEAGIKNVKLIKEPSQISFAPSEAPSTDSSGVSFSGKVAGVFLKSVLTIALVVNLT